ncbi:PTS sugar transporter subunit IIA, partial [Anaerostipes sp.]|uniref:PTS sugar transporter subunit IIA n=1 Tax=Anaerostipes sp. TaxID=1872530 RepID=UPI003FF14C7A
LLEPDKIMIRSKLSELKKTRKKIKQTNVEKTKNKKQISRADIEYMVILGREILQVLDNIKISPEVTFEDKKSLIACAGNLFARTEEDAQIITKDLIRREDISSTYIPGMNVLFLHSETRGVKHCRFGYIALKEPVTEKNREIKGAILMLIPKAHDIRIYREVMSEISGALAEKDHVINALYRKDRRSVELQLEESLGNYYEKRSNQK